MTSKPKLLYLRPKIKENTSPFIKDFLFYQREKIQDNFFELILIEDAHINYENLLKLHKPDMVFVIFTPMFQEKFTIQNINYQDSTIPRIAFMPADGFSTERYNLYEFHETIFKPHAYFSSETTYGGIDYKFLSDKIFYFPWCIDKEIFKNYNLEKNNNIVILGNHGLTYPWRSDIFPIIEQEYKYYRLQYPKDGKGIYGADFSKIVNQSTFAPTCGGYTDALVRKHFEIPASYCCLITEKTEATLQAGFVDMENCVFADKENFREKINFLLQNPQKVAEITQKGYDFVMQQHTDQHRTQLLDWYHLFKQKKEHQYIIQPSLFGKLEIAENTERHYHQKENKFTRLADEANILFWQGNIQAYKDKYLWANSNYLHYSPDILTPLCLADLCLGDLDKSMQWLKYTLEFEVQHESTPNIIEYSLVFLAAMLKKNVNVKDLSPHIFTQKIGNFAWYDFTILLWAVKAKNRKIADICVSNLQKPYPVFENTHTFFDLKIEKIISIFKTIFEKNNQIYYLNIAFEKLKKTSLKPRKEFLYTFSKNSIPSNNVYQLYFLEQRKSLFIRGFYKLKRIIKKIIGRK